ncbi:unnamed protein product [Spirodela intermedia]|uniref:Uncharacterized protein n=1 Tax=Spirodela intermedia TaxID=51605 RepID=A0A7I8J0X4_SPIIN|nr:unnamed protein product [Spirodela intermedia]CAA6663622.1 unnamed protein product [Spirodela intermedia]
MPYRWTQSNIHDINEWLVSKKVSKLQFFFGLVNYYYKFVQGDS